MHALYLTAPGNEADSIQRLELSHDLEPGKVRVRMLAAPINPSDLLHIAGNYGSVVNSPARIGFEGVGIVETATSFLGRLLIGRRVAVLARDGGTWATHCDVDFKSVIPVPSALSLEQAATFFINPATAYLVTRDVLRIPKQGTLIQSAGASAVGRMVIQLAKVNGFRTVNLVRRGEQVEELKGLGADHAIVVDESCSVEEIETHIKSEVAELPIRYVIDPVGGKVGTAMLQCLADGGQFVSYGSLADQSMEVHPRLMMTRNLQMRGFWLGPYMQKKSLASKLMIVRKLASYHKQGHFDSQEYRSFPLDDYQNAMQFAANASGGTKALLTMQAN